MTRVILMAFLLAAYPAWSLGADAKDAKAPDKTGAKAVPPAPPTQKELELSKALLDTQKQNLELQYQRIAEQIKQVQEELDKRAAAAKKEKEKK